MCSQSFSRFIDLMSFDDFSFCLKCLSSPQEATYRKLLGKELCWWIYPGRFSIGSHRFKPGIGLSTIAFCRLPCGGKAESREISDFRNDVYCLWESRTFQKFMIVINSGIGTGISICHMSFLLMGSACNQDCPEKLRYNERSVIVPTV